MLLNELAKIIQDELNKSGEYTFFVTDIHQLFYNWDVKDNDGNNYVPCIIRTLSSEVLTNFYATRNLDYVITLKGLEKDRVTIENIINNLSATKISNKETLYFSPLTVTDIEKSKDGKNQTEFYGSFRITLTIPTVITGNDVKVKIDGIDVDILSFNGTYDKGLVVNKTFNNPNNISDILTGQEIVVSFPITTNTKVNEVLSSVLNKEYNKVFTFEFDFVVFTQTSTLSLRKGVIDYNNTDNPISFTCVFERSTNRQNVTINDVTIPVTNFSIQMVADVQPKQLNKKSMSKMLSASHVFTMQFENNKSSILDEIISEIIRPTGKTFSVGFTYDTTIGNAEEYHECIILNSSIPSVDNPMSIITVTFGSGYNG